MSFFFKWTLLNLTFNDVDRSCLPVAVISNFGVTDIILFPGPTSKSSFYKFVFATRYDHASMIMPVLSSHLPDKTICVYCRF